MSVKDVMEEYHKRYTNHKPKEKIAPWNRFIDGYKKDDRWFYRRLGKPPVNFDDRNYRKMSEILDNESLKEQNQNRWGGKKTRRLKTNRRKSRRK
jgi:hypothetical protein